MGDECNFDEDGGPCYSQCHAARDGDCYDKDCPQEREGEPAKSGRHCPLDFICAVHRRPGR